MTASSTLRDRRAWLACAGLLAVAAIPRLAGIRSMPLWKDEKFTLQYAESGFEALLQTGRSHPPGYPLLAQLLLSCGGGDWTIRVPALLGGLLCVVAVALLLRGSDFRGRAWFGAALAAASVYAVYYSSEARGYSCMSALVGLAAFYTARYLGSPTARALVGALACSSLAVGTHYLAAPSALVLVSLLLGRSAHLLLTRRRPGTPPLRGIAIVTAVFAAACAGALVVFRTRIAAGMSFLDSSASTAVMVSPGFVAEVIGRWSGLGHDYRWLAVATAVVGTVACFRARPVWGAVLVATAAAPFLVVAAMPWPHLFESRYLAAAFVPGFALFACGAATVCAAVAACLRAATGRPEAQLARALAALPFALVVLVVALPTLDFARAPAKVTPAWTTSDFGYRHVIFHSRLDPWMIRSRRSDDYTELRTLRVGPLELPVPHWNEPVRRQPAAHALELRNPYADETLKLAIDVGPRTGGFSGTERPQILLERKVSPYTDGKLGQTVLNGRFPRAGVSFALHLNSSRLALAQDYVEIVSERMRLVRE